MSYVISMPRYLKHLLTVVTLIVLAAFLAFLHDCVAGLAGFAGRLNPAFEPWVFWTLAGLVGGLILWGVGQVLLRPRPLLLHAAPTEAEMAEFRRALAKRLRANPVVREAGIDVRDAADLEPALALLGERADEEIRATGKRVFIGTALSQNGRLDAMVVLFLVMRLVWRLARLFNQRPHPRELMNLYANIAATTFLAGSVEDIGIEEYVRELMAPLVGGSAVGALPGAQAIAGVITSSVLTGSTNCLLTLRCGIIARNYLSLSLDGRGAMRRNATIEAARMFMGLSTGTVAYVTKVLVKGSTGALRSGTSKVVHGVGDAITGTAGKVGGTAGSVIRSGRDTVRRVTDAFKRPPK
ncbi:DUF697 domain-containing protein [Pseudodesulfovibrio sp.]|uniref:DUF697 domain-containing protein n=1 Tax=Pseudodesulfovibrio sp. TaxID=2035812 RepID=UPI002623F79E|nr:DUF697 domain-containing protein [Pseudodesulfovibrio sp.]MDD3311392.1 DUF697 domain-containing protein [Pseudodesulfovibrio sp.]